MQRELSKRSNNLAKLKKKESEVLEILKEGEKLSKMQFESEQTIKRLRAQIHTLEADHRLAEDRGLGNLDDVHAKLVKLQAQGEDYQKQVATLTMQVGGARLPSLPFSSLSFLSLLCNR